MAELKPPPSKFQRALQGGLERAGHAVGRVDPATRVMEKLTALTQQAKVQPHTGQLVAQEMLDRTVELGKPLDTSGLQGQRLSVVDPGAILAAGPARVGQAGLRGSQRLKFRVLPDGVIEVPQVWHGSMKPKRLLRGKDLLVGKHRDLGQHAGTLEAAQVRLSQLTGKAARIFRGAVRSRVPVGTPDNPVSDNLQTWLTDNPTGKRLLTGDFMDVDKIARVRAFINEARGKTQVGPPGHGLWTHRDADVVEALLARHPSVTGRNLRASELPDVVFYLNDVEDKGSVSVSVLRRPALQVKGMVRGSRTVQESGEAERVADAVMSQPAGPLPFGPEKTRAMVGRLLRFQLSGTRGGRVPRVPRQEQLPLPFLD
jgi:hypothetical protein